MGRAFVNASSQYMTVASSPVSALPVTLSAWIKPNSVGSIPHGWILQVSRADTSNGIALRQFNGGGTYLILEAGDTPNVNGLVAGVWQHVVGVVQGTSRIAYLNGVAGGEATDPFTLTAMTQVDVARYPGGGANGFDGLIAEPAIWDVALSVPDITALAAGASPMSLANRPKRYWRFKDDLDFSDLIAGQALTNGGSTWTSDHPTVDDPPPVPGGWPGGESLGSPSKQRAPMPMIVGPREDRIMSMQGRQKG